VLFTAFEALLNARIEGAIASGTYDQGLETLVAERFTVTDRQVIHVHEGTCASTSLLTIAQRSRNQPLSLQGVLAHLDHPAARLLINARSGRAAIQVPAPSLMLDDGEIERRVRLIRPMETQGLPLNAMAETHWQAADQTGFAQAWTAELTEIPEFTDRTIHIVTGLLLPIWKRLPQDAPRVYRLQTDEGERIVGRLVPPAWAAIAVAADKPNLSASDAFTALCDGKTVLELEGGLQLRRVNVMHAARIELTGFSDGERERLKAMGLFSEIIAWKLRLFVPNDASAPAVLARLMDRYPLMRIISRETS
jgi:hypothetical protein